MSALTDELRAVVGLLERVEPQPPRGIRYMLGGETWLPLEKRSPLRMHIEEWGNLGPMELNPDIQDNGHGFRVRSTDIPAPVGALGFATVDGITYWTATDMYGRTAEQREADTARSDTASGGGGA